MKPLTINLASRPFYNTRLYLVAFAASGLLLLVMTGLNLLTLFQSQAAWKLFGENQTGLQSELRALDHEMLTLERELQSRNLAEVRERSDFANIAIVQRMFSWTLMFNRLEQVMPPTVKLRSLRPKVDEYGIHFRVNGTSKTSSAFADFEEALLKEPLFSEVYPLSEAVSSSGKGIDFSLSFRYLSAMDTQPGALGAATDQPPQDAAARARAASEAGVEEGAAGKAVGDGSQEASS